MFSLHVDACVRACVRVRAHTHTHTHTHTQTRTSTYMYTHKARISFSAKNETQIIQEIAGCCTVWWYNPRDVIIVSRVWRGFPDVT